jgi:hypothetical protein
VPAVTSSVRPLAFNDPEENIREHYQNSGSLCTDYTIWTDTVDEILVFIWEKLYYDEEFHILGYNVVQSFGSQKSSACYLRASCLAYSSTLKKDTTCSSETSVTFQGLHGPYMPEYRTLRNHPL